MARPTFELPPPVKYTMPVGGLLDVPTGDYLKGIHDQYVLQGGVSHITGLVGPGNSFKTTIMRYMIFTALSRMLYTVDDCWGVGYDTEINAHERRNDHLARQASLFRELDVMRAGIWSLTDKTVYDGGAFWDYIKKIGRESREDKKKKLYATAFSNRELNGPMMIPAPSYIDYDSLSHFYGADVEDMLEKTQVGDTAGQTVFMKAGLAKKKMLMEMPVTAGANFQYFLFTAHLGKEINMASSPHAAPPRKQLQGLNEGEVIKGVSNDFFYLLHNCWYLQKGRPYLNQGTKAPEYPHSPGDEVAGDTDLNIVTVKQLRGKNGGTGFTIDLMCSQREGYLPGLSQFHYLKNFDRYGLEGSVQNYSLTLCPDISLSRTSVRKKIRESARLQRALEITSELAQIQQYHPDLRSTIMTPAELKKGLEERGYDLEMILTQTRGWHTLDDDDFPGFPWSTIDLCRAAKGDFHPYWLKEDKKTLDPILVKRKEDSVAKFKAKYADFITPI